MRSFRETVLTLIKRFCNDSAKNGVRVIAAIFQRLGALAFARSPLPGMAGKTGDRPLPEAVPFLRG